MPLSQPALNTAASHIEGLPFGTRGGILIKYQFPVDGDYSFRIKGVTGYFQAVLGGVKGEQLEIMIDGQKVHQFDWDRDISNTTGNGKATPKIHVKAGLHTLGVTFLQTNDLPGTEMDKPFARTMNTPGTIPGFLFYPHVGQVWIEGPYDGKGATDTATRKKIFVCKPASKVMAMKGTPRQILAKISDMRALLGSPRKLMFSVIRPILRSDQEMIENWLS